MGEQAKRVQEVTVHEPRLLFPDPPLASSRLHHPPSSPDLEASPNRGQGGKEEERLDRSDPSSQGWGSRGFFFAVRISPFHPYFFGPNSSP